MRALLLIPALLVLAAAAQVIPAKPGTDDPVRFFRRLLAMKPAEREQSLAAEPPEKRACLALKLREYDALKPGERELRLRVTQLRYHLSPLLALAPAARIERLARIPAEERKLVAERLEQWDKLPADLRREVLENESLMHSLLRLQSSSPELQRELLDAMPAGKRLKLQQDLARWNSLAADRRSRMLASFNEFFSLQEREKARILDAVQGADRPEIERTIQAFERLPEKERTLCINSLQRFASLTPERQIEFFSNAERWAKLSESERQIVRELVVQMPPLPPGFDEPPMPPGMDEPTPPPVIPK